MVSTSLPAMSFLWLWECKKENKMHNEFWLDLEETLCLSALLFPENRGVTLQGEIVTDIDTRKRLKIHWGNQMRL